MPKFKYYRTYSQKSLKSTYQNATPQLFLKCGISNKLKLLRKATTGLALLQVNFFAAYLDYSVRKATTGSRFVASDTRQKQDQFVAVRVKMPKKSKKAPLFVHF